MTDNTLNNWWGWLLLIIGIIGSVVGIVYNLCK